MLDCFSHVHIFATLLTVACQIPLSMGFHRQEFWTGEKKKRILDWVAILFQEIFPSWGSNPCLFVSPALARGFFTISATWKASINLLSSAFSKTSTTALFLRLCFHRPSVKFYHVVYHLKLY